jgi:hypothetical protein
LELGSVQASVQNSLNASQLNNSISSSHEKIPWKKAVAVCAASLGVLGPLMWIYILTNIWKPSKSVFFITIAALAFLTVRLLGKIGALLGRQKPASLVPWLQQILVKAAAATKKLRQKSETEPSLFVLRWIWERDTTVNLFSVTWILVIGIYCVRLFPEHNLEGLGEPPEKPMWLDWLG